MSGISSLQKRGDKVAFPAQAGNQVPLPQTIQGLFFKAKSHLTVYLGVKGAAQDIWVVPGEFRNNL